MCRLIALLIVMAVTLSGHAAIAKETRVALVIGNGAYKHSRTLTNPPNDARAIATMIGRMGFDSADLTLDRDRDAFRDELRKFAKKARDADLALVYFAGHGIEIGGVNYLLPTDVRLKNEEDVGNEAIALDEVLQAVQSARKLRIVVLDACRDNPFANRMIRRDGTTRGVSSGLAPIDSTGEVLVAFAAKHGTTAADGDSDNSPYAEALLRHLPTPGLDIRIMFGRVRDQVLKATEQGQEPYIYGSIGGQQIYLTRSVLADAEPPRYSRDKWVQTNGPYAGTPHAIALDPNLPDVLYAVVEDGRLHRSLDEGRSWAQLGDPAPKGAKLTAVGSVGGSQYLLFAGTTGALYVRRSDVSPWEKLPYFDKLGQANVRSIATSAREPGLVYVGSGAHTFTATASSSVGLATTGGPLQEGQTIKIEWKDEPFEGGNLHRSLDGGRTWTTGGLPITNSLAIALGNPNVIVAATSDDGVFATTDAGLNWTHFNCLGTRYVSEQVAVSPHDPMLAAIATDKGAFVLDLASEPHCRRLGTFDSAAAVAWSRKNARRLLLGTNQGVFESLDRGATFHAYSNGLMHKRVIGLQVTEAEMVVARVDGPGIATRGPEDAAWSTSISRFERAGVGAIAFDASGNLYSGTVVGPLVSENSGSTFRWLMASGSEVMAIATFPRDERGGDRKTLSWSPTGNLLVGTQTGAIFRSTDSGGTWQHTYQGSDSVWAFAVDRSQRLLLAAAGKGGVLASHDGGVTWVAAKDGLGDALVASITIASGTPTRAYVGTGDGRVFVADTDKLTWHDMSYGLPKKPVLALAHEKGSPGRIWAATEGAGVFVLDDGAAAWRAHNDGLDILDTIALAIDPVEPHHVYLSSHSGVHVSRDGARWSRAASGLDDVNSINAIAISPDGRMLFAGENHGLYGLLLR